MSGAAGTAPTSPSLTRLIIDTDGGLDDAQALMLALASDDVTIEGITAVSGSTHVDHVCRNIRKVLDVCRRTDVPIYKGSSEGLVQAKYEQTDNSNGTDGLGDVKDDVISDNFLEPGHAALFLMETVSKNPRQISLICLGPLTNIALAMKLDPKFGENLKECQIMGGTYRAQGNVNLCTEFNFHFDPEAAKIVLQNLKCPTTTVCYEVSIDHPISWDQYDKVFCGSGPVRQFIREHEGKRNKRRRKHHQPYLFYDQFVMAIFIDRRVAGELFQAAAEIELEGRLTRGMMIVKRKVDDTDHPITITMKVRMEKFLDQLMLALDKLDQRVIDLNTSHNAQPNHKQERKLSKAISAYLPSPTSSNASSK